MLKDSAVEVHLFFRARRPGAVSIERLFRNIQAAFPEEVRVRCVTLVHASRGVVPRMLGILEAWRNRGGLNHITGDVHYLAFGLPGRSTVLTIHDCGNLHRLTGWRRWFLKKLWFDWPMKKVAIVTTISEATKNELVSLTECESKKIYVIPNCIGPEFVPAPKEWPAKNPVALMIGSTPTKNLRRQIQALKGTGVKVIHVGKEVPEIAELARNNGVSFEDRGELRDDQVLEAFKECDFVMFCSLREGFGLPLLEAQATGRPVITSDFSAMPEVAGEGAFFVDPFSEKSIRNGVCELIKSEEIRRKLIAMGYDNVKRFNPKNIANQYVEVYRKVWGEQGRS